MHSKRESRLRRLFLAGISVVVVSVAAAQPSAAAVSGTGPASAPSSRSVASTAGDGCDDSFAGNWVKTYTGPSSENATTTLNQDCTGTTVFQSSTGTHSLTWTATAAGDISWTYDQGGSYTGTCSQLVANVCVSFATTSSNNGYSATGQRQYGCTDGSVVDGADAQEAVTKAESSGYYSPEQIANLRGDPCKLLVPALEVEQEEPPSGEDKGNGFMCPSSGQEAPSIRWRIKDIYGLEYGYLKISQYFCWNGKIVSNATGDGPPPDPVVTGTVTDLGKLAGLNLDSLGSTTKQYEQYNNQAKGSWRAVSTGAKINAQIFWGVLKTYQYTPVLTLVVRNDGSVIRECIPSGGSCP